MSTVKDSAYNVPTAFTIALASLANSAAGVGRQSAEIDNTTTRFNRILVSASIKLGTTPTASGVAYLYLIRNNNATTPLRDDNAGAADAAITIKNAQLIGTISAGTAPATGDVLTENFIINDVGPKWAIALVNSTGVSLDATAANHTISYSGITLDVV